MILLLECVCACMVFGIGIVASVLKYKVFWLQEYAPEVQERYLSLHPEHRLNSQTKKTVVLVGKKVAASILFAVILTGMVYLAGARTFWEGTLYCYIIWFVVNWFDVFVLDLWILAHWKKVRLPGTEDMDEAYQSNNRKSVMDGFWGMGIGIVVSALVGGMLLLVV